jgi:hypothetical protein
MELALNLAWFLLALVMVSLWLRQAPRQASQRRAQMIALGVLLIILLPAISMTDDLIAAQNPAEVDSSLRRDHEYVRPHAIFPAPAALLQLAFAGLSFDAHRQAAPRRVFAPAFPLPALAAIHNRPPPAC